MTARLQNADPTVQVVGDLTTEARIATFFSYPSGSVLIRVISEADYQADSGNALLNALSDAVESILGEGIATAAVGNMTFESSGLLQDNVTFTVIYVPSYPTVGTITGDVTIRVSVITADTGLLGGAGAASAPDLILAEYNRLKALAGE